MNPSKKLYCVMDESDRPYVNGECPYKFTLEDDLLSLLTIKESNLELDPNSDLAKLELEMAKCGLEVTPDTNLKQLAATVRLLGIA